jgi:hypothetical protein
VRQVGSHWSYDVPGAGGAQRWGVEAAVVAVRERHPSLEQCGQVRWRLGGDGRDAEEQVSRTGFVVQAQVIGELADPEAQRVLVDIQDLLALRAGEVGEEADEPAAAVGEQLPLAVGLGGHRSSSCRPARYGPGARRCGIGSALIVGTVRRGCDTCGQFAAIVTSG